MKRWLALDKLLYFCVGLIVALSAWVGVYLSHADASFDLIAQDSREVPPAYFRFPNRSDCEILVTAEQYNYLRNRHCVPVDSAEARAADVNTERLFGGSRHEGE